MLQAKLTVIKLVELTSGLTTIVGFGLGFYDGTSRWAATLVLLGMLGWVPTQLVQRNRN